MMVWKNTLLVISAGIVATSAIAGNRDYFPNDRSKLRLLGITEQSHPKGTGKSIQFNLFTDNGGLGQLKRQIPLAELSTDRVKYAKENGLERFIDERDFASARLMVDDEAQDLKIKYDHHVKDLELGDKVRVFVLIHNTATEFCSGGNYAKNVTASINWNNPRRLIASVSARNATPRKINDIVTFSFAGDYTFKAKDEVLLLKRNHPDYFGVGSKNYGVCTKIGDDSLSLTKRPAQIGGATAETKFGRMRAGMQFIYFDLEVVSKR